MTVLVFQTVRGYPIAIKNTYDSFHMESLQFINDVFTDFKLSGLSIFHITSQKY